MNELQDYLNRYVVEYHVSDSAVDFFYDLEMLVLQKRTASEENILEVY